RDVRRLADQRLRLLLAPAMEAIRRRAALPVAVLDEPSADLRAHEPLSVEHAGGVAAEAHEKDGDQVVAHDLLEERRDVDRVVRAGVREPERRRKALDTEGV